MINKHLVHFWSCIRSGKVYTSCNKGAATGGETAQEIHVFPADHNGWQRGCWLSLGFES